MSERNHYAQNNQPKARLIISFISFASGIDHTAKQDINEMIAGYEKKTHQTRQRTLHGVKDGEIDYRFKLS